MQTFLLKIFLKTLCLIGKDKKSENKLGSGRFSGGRKQSYSHGGKECLGQGWLLTGGGAALHCALGHQVLTSPSPHSSPSRHSCPLSQLTLSRIFTSYMTAICSVRANNNQQSRDFFFFFFLADAFSSFLLGEKVKGSTGGIFFMGDTFSQTLSH